MYRSAHLRLRGHNPADNTAHIVKLKTPMCLRQIGLFTIDKIILEGVDMVEKTHNNTRTGLILLVVIIGIIMGILAADFAMRTKAYEKVHDRDEWRYSYKTENYFFDDEIYERNEDAYFIVADLCDLAMTVSFPLILFLIVSMTLLFSSRKAYGPKHAKNIAFALAFFILAPLMVIVLDFSYGGDTMGDIVGLFPALGIALFLISLFFVTYELTGRRYSIIGLLLGIVALIPLSRFSYFEDLDYDGAKLRLYCIYFMIADAGLFIALSLYIASIKRALDFTKKHPASPEKPHIPPEKPRQSLSKRLKGIFGNKKLTTAIIVVIVILSAVGIYWFVIRVPDLEEFLQDSYSEGETARFSDEVMKIKIVETSYGTATLVWFKDYYYPFCFMGDHSEKYMVGKTVVVEVVFHEYDIDGINVILPEELLLGYHLFTTESIDQFSSPYNYLSLRAQKTGNEARGIKLNVSLVQNGEKTFSLNHYEMALSQFNPLDESYKAIKESAEDGYSLWSLEDIESDTLIYDFHEMNEMREHLYYELWGYWNCTDQKSHDSYLPGSYEYNDYDNDGNVSDNDSISINIQPTVDRYTIDHYLFRIAGITIGDKFLMNWYDGPFYLVNDVNYIKERIEETKDENKYSYKIIIDDISIPIELKEIEIAIYSIFGYMPSFKIFDGMEIHYDGSLIRFSDTNKNGLLDNGDYFNLENLDGDIQYSFNIRKEWVILDFTTIPRYGRIIGNYPIPTIQEPERTDGNITFSVAGMDGKYPRITSLGFEIYASGKRMPILIENDEEDQYSYPGIETINITIVDTDNNTYLAPDDEIIIKGLEPNTEIDLKIWWNRELVIYKWNGTI